MGGPKKEEEEKKAKKKANILKVDPAFLVDGPKGLKRLYKRVVMDGDKHFQFKGKGHELSDFNKVMNQLRAWHFEAMPKFQINYFAERLQKAGNEKEVRAFMSKLRLVHKGLEVLEDFQTLPGEEGAATGNQ